MVKFGKVLGEGSHRYEHLGTAGDDPGENVSWEFFATDISHTNDDWMEYYGDWMEYDTDNMMVI